MRVTAVLLVLLACSAAPAFAVYCGFYSSTGGTGSSTSCSVSVSYGQRIAAAITSSQTDVFGVSGTGDTVLCINLPGVTTSCSSTSSWKYNDDSCTELLSYIPFQCVPYSGTYQVKAECFGSRACSGTVGYEIDTYSGTCFTGTCHCTTGGTSGCSTSGSGSTNSGNSANSGNNGAGTNSGGYSPFVDVSNKGWAAPAALAAVIGLVQIVCWAIYGTRVASDMACCGCAPTAADKRLPSVMDSPAGSMHMHTLAVVVLLPLSATLVFIAMCVDAYEVLRDQRDAMFGAFSLHQKSDRTAYSDRTVCPAQQGNVYNANNRMCPSLRAAGAMTFIGELLGLFAFVAAVINFAASSPYAASGKTMFTGGKPVIPRYACRLIEFFSMSVGMSALMWIAAGHGALSWYFSYVLNDSGYVTLGPSWALLIVGAILAIFPAIIARREAVRDQPAAGAAASGVVPGAQTNQATAAAPQQQPAMQQQQPAMQQPYGGGAVYGGQGVPMQQMGMAQYAAPQQPGLTGYAPQYAQNAPPPAYGAAPPAYAVAQPQPMMQQQPQVVVMQQQPMAAVVRVPVQPPAGLALPPGAILYSNGDVCDTAGNVLGVVPGMRPQAVAVTAVPMAGTA